MNTDYIQPKPLDPMTRQKLYDKSYAKAYAHARSEGNSDEYTIAYAQSYAENYVYGYALGMAEADYEIAQRMKKLNLSVGIIMQVTGLTETEIEQL